MVRVHSDVAGAHYTIRTLGKGGKEKNTDASHISKVSLEGDVCGGDAGGAGCPDNLVVSREKLYLGSLVSLLHPRKLFKIKVWVWD